MKTAWHEVEEALIFRADSTQNWKPHFQVIIEFNSFFIFPVLFYAKICLSAWILKSCWNKHIEMHPKIVKHSYKWWIKLDRREIWGIKINRIITIRPYTRKCTSNPEWPLQVLKTHFGVSKNVALVLRWFMCEGLAGFGWYTHVLQDEIAYHVLELQSCNTRISPWKQASMTPSRTSCS